MSDCTGVDHESLSLEEAANNRAAAMSAHHIEHKLSGGAKAPVPTTAVMSVTPFAGVGLQWVAPYTNLLESISNVEATDVASSPSQYRPTAVQVVFGQHSTAQHSTAQQ